jgi:hypothetical protein
MEMAEMLMIMGKDAETLWPLSDQIERNRIPKESPKRQN